MQDIKENANADSTNQNNELIKETNSQNFIKDVVEDSKEVLIIVDFWAPWCNPCKQLTPNLEEVVKEFAGAVKLVKINVDENQAIAAQLRVQSVPAVFAFKDERPVDGFMGALPKSQIIEFVNKHVDIDKINANDGVSIKDMLEQADTLFDAGDINAAKEMFVSVFQMDGTNLSAILGFAKCFIELSEIDNAKESMALVPSDNSNDLEVKSLNAKIELSENSANQEDIKQFLDRLEKDNSDHEAMFEIAKFHNANNDKDQAVDILIKSIRLGRSNNDEEARKLLLQLFESWGFDDPASVRGRKKLSTILFA